MERRKFFKSLGLLSIAVVLPKFLFGKEEKIKYPDLPEDFVNNSQFTNRILWSEKSVNIIGNIDENAGWISKDVIWDGVVTVDYSVVPKNMKLSEWYDYFHKGTLYYDGKKCNVRPREFKEGLLDGSNLSVKHNTLTGNPKRKTLVNISKLQVIDYVSGWRIDPDNFCNYMSIERYPS